MRHGAHVRYRHGCHYIFGTVGEATVYWGVLVIRDSDFCPFLICMTNNDDIIDVWLVSPS